MTKVFRGNGQVWDPSQARVIAKFERAKGVDIDSKGTFTTSDERLIARLEAMGYKGEPVDGEPEAPAPVVAAPLGDDAGGTADGEPVAAPVAAGEPEAPKARGGRKPKAEG